MLQGGLCQAGAVLPPTLKHCLALDYPDYEVIVVDDGGRASLEPTVAPFRERLSVWSRIIEAHIREKDVVLDAGCGAGCDSATGGGCGSVSEIGRAHV